MTHSPWVLEKSGFIPKARKLGPLGTSFINVREFTGRDKSSAAIAAAVLDLKGLWRAKQEEFGSPQCPQLPCPSTPSAANQAGTSSRLLFPARALLLPGQCANFPPDFTKVNKCRFC